MKFYVLKDEVLAKYKNDYEKVLDVLEKVMDEKTFLKLVKTSE